MPCDYELYRCPDSGLEYAWPLIPARQEFYNWCVRSGPYYPSHRWEWDKVIELAAGASILDVGCGDGNFLAMARDAGLAGAVGLDFCSESVERCRAQGLKAYTDTVDGAVAAGRFPPNSFDFVVSFHCLEHIPDPLAFMVELKHAVKPGGAILVSTPYSPMSFEADYFDVMNHPPHHMGRWNEQAYQYLAEKIDLKVSIYSSDAGSHLRRAVRTFRLVSGLRGQSSRRLLTRMILRPLRFVHCLCHQIYRPSVNGSTAGDIVLVKFHAES